jgi:hypothetical protein
LNDLFFWDVDVPDDYEGPRLDETITKEFVEQLIDGFKNGKKLHSRFFFFEILLISTFCYDLTTTITINRFMWQILFQAKELLEKEKTLVDVSTKN